MEFASAGRGEPRDVDDLLRRVAEAASVGYAIVDEEFEPGLVAAAAPVRAYHGRVIAAINVSGPKFRFGKRLAEAGVLTRRAADELTAVLGGGGEPAGAAKLDRRAGVSGQRAEPGGEG